MPAVAHVERNDDLMGSRQRKHIVEGSKAFEDEAAPSKHLNASTALMVDGLNVPRQNRMQPETIQAIHPRSRAVRKATESCQTCEPSRSTKVLQQPPSDNLPLVVPVQLKSLRRIHSRKVPDARYHFPIAHNKPAPTNGPVCAEV